MSAGLPVRVGEAAGEARALDGERLSIVLDRALAPGTPVRIVAALATGALEVDGRATGSRRRADGRFDVGVRLVNLRRSSREALAAALAALPLDGA